jgi:hypothetical protein
MICPTGKMENFLEKDWTDGIGLKGFDKFGFWRNRFLAQMTARLPGIPRDHQVSRFRN